VLQDLAEQIRASTDGRYIHLIAENADNQARWLRRRDDGAPWLYDAQWSDDVHHGLHSAITGERQWYYADYAGRVDLVGRALAEGLAWQGEFMEHEERSKGEPSTFLPATAFVSYAQNHDQIGNRPFGERLSHLVPPVARGYGQPSTCCHPRFPMIFMGEEWGALQPFCFFGCRTGPCRSDPAKSQRGTSQVLGAWGRAATA
jgi:1,4-alpha-glucan branching enzyme